MNNAKVQFLDIPSGRRVLAISDIHANLPYFRALLAQVGFCESDELILVGDFLEKGPCSLETLRFIMELSKHGNVHPLCGNCDYWYGIFSNDTVKYAWVPDYIRTRRYGILWDMCREAGIDVETIGTVADITVQLLALFPEEWEFLMSLPHILRAGRYTFAHAAIDPEKPLDAQELHDVLRCDALVNTERRFKDWVVVGHWPVMLYRENYVSAAPLIDRERHIISIDGGCVLKDDGQLNALIIPDITADEFSYAAYDPFPAARVLADQNGSERSYYIRWGDSTVEVLERGEEFSRCRHVRTGYEMDILTKYLFSSERITGCNDCTDYVLPLKKGDVVHVVERTSRGIFAKHNSVSGWVRVPTEMIQNGEK